MEVKSSASHLFKMAYKRKLNTSYIEVKKQTIDEVEKIRKRKLQRSFGLQTAHCLQFKKNKATILKELEDGLGKRKKLKTS